MPNRGVVARVIGTPATTNVANAGRFRYTGQMYFPEYGLYSYKARFYSPTLGRFMQADPIEYEDGVNLYDYVEGDPVNFVDPTGLKARDRAPEKPARPNGKSGCDSEAGTIVVCGAMGWSNLPGLGSNMLSVVKGGGRGGAVSAGGAVAQRRKAVKKAPQSDEERRRGACAAPSTTPVLDAIGDISEIVATGADTVAAIAVFVPGGQGVAGTAKLVSFGAQGIQASSNYAIGRYTGNYSRLQAQGAGAFTGAIFGNALSAGTGAVKYGTKALSKGAKNRLGAFGDSVGAVVGDSTADSYCGR